jgi:GR25 family glycosyltransferase involved in LPS biosynthesis
LKSEESIHIGVFVISMNGSNSNSTLQNLIDHQLNLDDITFIQAVTPNDICNFGEVHKHKGWPRELTCVEVAISHSHVRARETASSHNVDIAIILEEDAQLGVDFLQTLKNSLIPKLAAKKPIGIHLFPEQFGILRKQKSEELYKIVKIPDYAVGYVLNSHALQVFTGQIEVQKKQIADWPKLARKIFWYAPKMSLVVHPDNYKGPTVSLAEKSRQTKRLNLKPISKLRIRINLSFLFYLYFKNFGQVYGKNPISSEKLRSYII